MIIQDHRERVFSQQFTNFLMGYLVKQTVFRLSELTNEKLRLRKRNIKFTKHLISVKFMTSFKFIGEQVKFNYEKRFKRAFKNSSI